MASAYRSSFTHAVACPIRAATLPGSAAAAVSNACAASAILRAAMRTAPRRTSASALPGSIHRASSIGAAASAARPAPIRAVA